MAIVRRDAWIFTAYRTRPFTQALDVFLSGALFYFVSGLIEPSRVGLRTSYFAFAIVGICAMRLASASLVSVPMSIRAEVMTGTLETIVLSRLGLIGAVFSATIFPIIISLLIAVVTLAESVLVFGLHLHWSTVALAVPFALLAALAFLPLSVFAVALTLVAKRAGSSVAYLTTGLSLTSGAFVPVSVLPSWLRWVSDVQPLTPALGLLRYALLGDPVGGGILAAVGKLIGFGIVLAPIGSWTLGRSIDFGRRFGTLTEY
jgi:ABC-2 type transport system permease protein